MIYCLNCGKGIPDDSKFCTFCGTPVAVVDPKQPNLATSASNKPVDVSRNYTSTKTVNEFYKDAGFWGAVIVLIGFFLPFFSMDGESLFEGVQNNISGDPWMYFFLIFPIAAIMVLLHSLFRGWPGFISAIFIILIFLALAILVYVLIVNAETLFKTNDFITIVKTAGIGMWATLVGTILLLFHRRHKKTIVSKTKIIDRSA